MRKEWLWRKRMQIQIELPDKVCERLEAEIKECMEKNGRTALELEMMSANVLVGMAIRINSDESTITLENVKNHESREVYGDYQIVIKKLRRKGKRDENQAETPET